MSSVTTTSGRYWDVTQLSEDLGVPKTWIYDRTRNDGPGVIPHLKFGKYVRFDPESDAFQQWLKDHEFGVGSGLNDQPALQAIDIRRRK